MVIVATCLDSAKKRRPHGRAVNSDQIEGRALGKKGGDTLRKQRKRASGEPTPNLDAFGTILEVVAQDFGAQKVPKESNKNP